MAHRTADHLLEAHQLSRDRLESAVGDPDVEHHAPAVARVLDLERARRPRHVGSRASSRTAGLSFGLQLDLEAKLARPDPLEGRWAMMRSGQRLTSTTTVVITAAL